MQLRLQNFGELGACSDEKRCGYERRPTLELVVDAATRRTTYGTPVPLEHPGFGLRIRNRVAGYLDVGQRPARFECERSGVK